MRRRRAGPRARWSLTGALAAAVVLRMAFHAVYLPAFEGPDEPQHLARVLDFERRPLGEALEGRWVDADVVAAVVSYPCPRTENGCPPHRGSSAFNLLREAPAPTTRFVQRIPNEEAKQAPLFYAGVGLALRWVGAPASQSPASTLLGVRLFNVLLIAFALFGPLRQLFRDHPGAARAGLIALLTPGACEAFARCSNDAAVFLWASLVVAALHRPTGAAAVAVLMAFGPLLKLTALANCAYAVGVLLTEKRLRAALAASLASLAVLPLRGLRGWGLMLSLGREASSVPAVPDSLPQWLLGVARSAYGVVKQPFWAGGWHNFRVPSLLVAFYAALVAVTLLTARVVRLRRLLPLVAGGCVALAGAVAYGVSIRRSAGVWGGLAGWYVWEWAPWMVDGASDMLAVDRRFVRPLLLAECGFVLASNVWWFAAAGAVYGG